jgi:hypothetical protein
MLGGKVKKNKKKKKSQNKKSNKQSKATAYYQHVAKARNIWTLPLPSFFVHRIHPKPKAKTKRNNILTKTPPSLDSEGEASSS